tara:strand:+ start:8375 stop:8746 length:372 start_codon:yes stop_codon:yes gene_type:complete
MKFIDSNIIVYAFYNNNYTEQCQEILRKGGIVNTFVLIEAFHIIEKEVNKEKAIEAIKAILKSHIKIIEIDTNAIFETMKRNNKLNLTIFDCIHYTTAKMHGCTEIISYDKDFNNLDIPRKEP